MPDAALQMKGISKSRKQYTELPSNSCHCVTSYMLDLVSQATQQHCVNIVSHG